MNYRIFFSLLFFSVGGFATLQHQLQMFQQNSYYPSRYGKWVCHSASITTIFSILFLVLETALLLTGAITFLPFLALFEAIFRLIKQQIQHKKSIKKLVYTKRVKRLLVTGGILFVLLCIAGLFLPEAIAKWPALLLLCVAHFPHAVLLAAWALNQPMETAINNHFLREAKQILIHNKTLQVLGVTGSYGKTSVKFMLKRLLSERFTVTATPESFNTPMGIVRTIREHLKPHTEIFIAEMGAKNKGDIKELCDLCNPSIGVITAVGPQHLETFHSVQTVADTKFELADHCLVEKAGKLYVNIDSLPAAEKAATYQNKNQIITYGTSDKADCRAENISYSPAGASFEVVYKEFHFSLTCKLLGRHSITNLLGAVAVALDFGVPKRQIRFAVSSLKPAPHRLECKPFLNGSLLIDDAYNSNPEGCLEAVRVLGSFEGMRRILVTPGLVELGDAENQANQTLGKTATEYCDDIIFVGKKRAVALTAGVDETDFDREHLIIAENFADAMKHLQSITNKNTVVLFENDLPDNYAG